MPDPHTDRAERGIEFDVLGIGNAIVDVLARCPDAFLDENDISKGTMSLIDEARAADLYDCMGPAVECSGGSVANSVAGVASLGGRGAYIGKVRRDQLGEVFTHDIRSLGVAFESVPADDGPSTARCFILVTPDGQRSMNTYLGACVNLGPEDVLAEQIAAAKVTYLEGYLWDKDRAKEAFRKAMRIAHDQGREVALSLSDPFCVDRHRAEFRDLVEEHVDILFANEAELLSLYQVSSFDEGLQRVKKHCKVAALTRSEKGSVIVSGDEIHVIDAARVEKVVDTTGAGDLYTAGFLFGYTHGYDLAASGKMASACAAEIIGHFGARPEVSLKEHLTELGLLGLRVVS